MWVHRFNSIADNKNNKQENNRSELRTQATYMKIWELSVSFKNGIFKEDTSILGQLDSKYYRKL